jgi:O-antigen/teichoic acid export membrane protein
MLVSRTLRTIPGQLAGPLAQIAGALLYTFLLDPAALGIWALALAAQELAYYGVLDWWTSYVQRYAAAHDGMEARRRLNATESGVLLVATLVQIVVASVAIGLMLGAIPPTSLVLAVAAFAATKNLVTHLATRARAEDADLAFTLLHVTSAVGGLVLSIVAAVIFKPTASALLLAFAVAQLLALAIGIPRMAFRPLRPKADPAMIRASWAYGAPLLVASLMEWVSTQGVRLIVQAQLGLAGVGLMTVAWWLGLRLTNLAALLVTGASFALAVNALDAQGPGEARRRLSDGSALLLALLVPATVGAILLASPIAQILVAPAYAETTGALLPMAVIAGAFRAYREHGPEQAFLLFGRSRATIWACLVEMVATLALTIAGLAANGLQGALIGCAIASMIAALFTHLYAWGTVGYVVRLGDVARIVTASSGMAAVVIILPSPNDWISFLLVVVAGCVAYAAASVAVWGRTLLSLLRRPATE